MTPTSSPWPTRRSKCACPLCEDTQAAWRADVPARVLLDHVAIQHVVPKLATVELVLQDAYDTRPPADE